ncbi:hypothetical protein GC177_00390 [bacterium]|nr:hypothetical protein [bacterium]
MSQAQVIDFSRYQQKRTPAQPSQAAAASPISWVPVWVVLPMAMPAALLPAIWGQLPYGG